MTNESRSQSLKSELWDRRAMAIVSMAFLVGFLLMVMFREGFGVLNASVNLWASSVQTDSLTFLTIMVSDVFAFMSLFVISCLTAAYLFMRKHWAAGLLLLGAMSGDALVVELAKTLAHTARPLNGLIHETSFGFPQWPCCGKHRLLRGVGIPGMVMMEFC